MAITSSSNYSFKVYTTKSNAETDTSPIYINSAGTGEISGHQDDQYFVGFTKYWYRIEFNEPVKGFYIDWDDGEDNSKEKSNSQVVTLDKPQHYGVVSHIYTKDGKFFPLIRSITMDGFWSKYYTSGHSENSFSEIEELSISNIGTGPQQNSIIHLDDTSAPVLPYLFPTTLPPVAVVKVDRKTVYSGIYNDLVEGQLALKGLPTFVYAWYSNEDESFGSPVNKRVAVEVKYETVGGEVKTTTLYTNYTADFNTYPVGIPDAWKILEARLRYCTEDTAPSQGHTGLLYPGERVYLRMSHVASIQSADNPVMTGQTDSSEDPSHIFIKSPAAASSRLSHPVGETKSILIQGTTNFNGRFSLKKTFQVDQTIQDGASCVVTTNIPHGIPIGEDVTISDCGTLNGTRNISAVTDPTHFTFLTSITGQTPGGAAKADILNGFMINKPSAEFVADEGTALGYWGEVDHSNDPVICSLSTGWPQHIFEDRGFFTTVDASESRTRASNLTIPESRNNLWMDKGDFSFNVQTAYVQNCTDRIDSVVAKVSNRMDTYRQRMAYTHDPYVDDTFVGVRGILDDRTVGGDDRFLDDYRLLRLQVKDDRTETDNNIFSYSKLENYNDYTQASNTGYNYPPAVEEQNIILETVNKGVAWDDCESENDDSANTIIDLLSADVITAIPLNYILMAKSERKFDRIFIGLKNVDTTNLKEYNLGRCRISIQYPVKDPLTDGIKFRALQFTDFTRAPKPTTHTNADDPDFVSLAVNGPLVFEAPDDWEKCKYNTSGIVWPTNVTAASDWDFDSYAIIITIAWEGSTSTRPQIKYIYPYDNTHSEIIKVIDSMHVSLNDILIAQSISWNRAGKYINITDRIGRSEIRKIGSEGGSVRFGGVAHGDYSTSTTPGMDSYNKMKKYQQEGTPVYLDVQRSDGTYVRFFGKITSLSEDLPVAKGTTRWGVDLATEAVAELTKEGAWLSDGLISLGGILDERPEFI